MTDLEKFIELYKGFGIPLAVNRESDCVYIVIAAEAKFRQEAKDYTYHENFVGYGGFCSRIEFSLEGEFLSQGFYE